MDKILTLDERKRGVAKALEMAKAPADKTQAPVKPAAAKPSPSKPPEKAPSAAKTVPPARGIWRVQLGAFSTRGAAEGLYKKLSRTSALLAMRLISAFSRAIVCPGGRRR